MDYAYRPQLAGIFGHSFMLYTLCVRSHIFFFLSLCFGVLIHVIFEFPSPHLHSSIPHPFFPSIAAPPFPSQISSLQKELKERHAVEADLRSQLSDLQTQLSNRQMELSVVQAEVKCLYTELDLMKESESRKDRRLGNYIEKVNGGMGGV